MQFYFQSFQPRVDMATLHQKCICNLLRSKTYFILIRIKTVTPFFMKDVTQSFEQLNIGETLPFLCASFLFNCLQDRHHVSCENQAILLSIQLLVIGNVFAVTLCLWCMLFSTFNYRFHVILTAS